MKTQNTRIITEQDFFNFIRKPWFFSLRVFWPVFLPSVAESVMPAVPQKSILSSTTSLLWRSPAGKVFTTFPPAIFLPDNFYFIACNFSNNVIL